MRERTPACAEAEEPAAAQRPRSASVGGVAGALLAVQAAAGNRAASLVVQRAKGCSMRWGRDTTCSKWGFSQGEHDTAYQGGAKWRSYTCCNSWPYAVEQYARDQLGINGAASCPVAHQKEIATVASDGDEVKVLCADTIPNNKYGPEPEPKACSAGHLDHEVIELSPKAMKDLSGQWDHPLAVTTTFSGEAQDLCLHNGPGKGNHPQAEHCLTKGCDAAEGTPKLQDTGWPDP